MATGMMSRGHGGLPGAERQQGKDVRAGNVTAIQAVANILKSSLGPMGLDKMLVDDIGEVVVSNDGATILKKLEVQHPAAKILVDLSQLQDSEVGDGTTSVVLVASSLLKHAMRLLEGGVHPTSVISGYKLACKEAVKYIKKELSFGVSDLGRDGLKALARTTISSKMIGIDSTHVADMVVGAIEGVKTGTDTLGFRYPVSEVSVVATHGGSLKDSRLLDGYVLRMGRTAQGMPTSVKDAKIAILNFNLRQHRMQMGIALDVKDPAELEKIREKEKSMAKAKVVEILKSGANVVLTSQGIDDLCLKYFVEGGIMACRRVEKADLRRLAKLTGATVAQNLVGPEGEDEFLPEWLGACDLVYEESLGDYDHILFEGCRGSKATAILLRGPNETTLEEAKRSVHDALCSVSRAMESQQLCCGAGCVETALNTYLRGFASTLAAQSQMAVVAFADALFVIPTTLAINAGLDAPELRAKLSSAHAHGEQFAGLNLAEGTISDVKAMGVFEPAISKIKSLRFATEAAVTILRIDDLIKIEPANQNPAGGR